LEALGGLQKLQILEICRVSPWLFVNLQKSASESGRKLPKSLWDNLQKGISFVQKFV
jgi:hypothetical protein